jgi:hypothetical protein
MVVKDLANNTPVMPSVQEEAKQSDPQQDERTVEELKEEYPNGLEYEAKPYQAPDESTLKVLIENLEDPTGQVREQAEEMVCSICLYIVKDPKECSECSHPFCTSCLDEWQQKSNTCPNKCVEAGKDVTFNNLHRFMKNVLDKYQFKCP